MSQLPPPARASLGLAVVALSAARSLPRRTVEFPVIAVSTALQVSLRAQQRYAELIAKGDEVLGLLRGVPEEPPAWATFDELPVPTSDGAQDEAAAADLAAALEGEVVAELLEEEAEAEALVDAAEAIAEILDTEALAAQSPDEGLAGAGETAIVPSTTPSRRPARPRKSTPASRTKPAATTGSARATGKGVPPPRNSRPSAFDRVSDDAPDPDVPQP